MWTKWLVYNPQMKFSLEHLQMYHLEGCKYVYIPDIPNEPDFVRFEMIAASKKNHHPEANLKEICKIILLLYMHSTYEHASKVYSPFT